MATVSASKFFGGNPGTVVQPAVQEKLPSLPSKEERKGIFETLKTTFKPLAEKTAQQATDIRDKAKVVISEGAEDVSSLIKTQSQKYGEEDSLIGKTAILGQSLGRAAMETAKTAGKLFAAPIEQGMETAIEAGGESPFAQSISQNPLVSKSLDSINQFIGSGVENYDEWKATNPELAKEAEGVAEIVLLATGEKASTEAIRKFMQATKSVERGAIGVMDTVGGATTRAIDSTVEGAKNVVTSPFKVVEKLNIEGKKGLAKAIYGPEGEKAKAALEKAYNEIPIPKTVMRNEAETGKSFANFMAEHPDKTIPVKNMKYDTWETAQSLRKEAQAEAKAVSELIANQPGKVTFDEIASSIKSDLSKSFKGQERVAAERYVENELNALRGQYGKGELSLPEANELKQTFWDRSPLGPSPTRVDKLASSLDYKLGQTMMRLVENKVPDADIRLLNQQLGNYYHAIEVLENLHGGAAKAGRIGQHFAQVGGAVIGSPGGVVGSLVGYMTADKIVKVLADPSVTTAFKRYAAKELSKARPTVAEQVRDIMVKQGLERDARLLLPAPSAIPVGPITPVQPPSSQFKAIPAQKSSIPGVNPETGKFERNYQSIPEGPQSKLRNLTPETTFPNQAATKTMSSNSIESTISQTGNNASWTLQSRFHPDDVSLMEDFTRAIKNGKKPQEGSGNLIRDMLNDSGMEAPKNDKQLADFLDTALSSGVDQRTKAGLGFSALGLASQNEEGDKGFLADLTDGDSTVTPIADRIFGKGSADKVNKEITKGLSKITGISEETLSQEFPEGTAGGQLLKAAADAFVKLKEFIKPKKAEAAGSYTPSSPDQPLRNWGGGPPMWKPGSKSDDFKRTLDAVGPLTSWTNDDWDDLVATMGRGATFNYNKRVALDFLLERAPEARRKFYHAIQRSGIRGKEGEFPGGTLANGREADFSDPVYPKGK